MTLKDKKELYNSIMESVAKQVKKALNESDYSDFDEYQSEENEYDQQQEANFEAEHAFDEIKGRTAYAYIHTGHYEPVFSEYEDGSDLEDDDVDEGIYAVFEVHPDKVHMEDDSFDYEYGSIKSTHSEPAYPVIDRYSYEFIGAYKKENGVVEALEDVETLFDLVENYEVDDEITNDNTIFQVINDNIDDDLFVNA